MTLPHKNKIDSKREQRKPKSKYSRNKTTRRVRKSRGTKKRRNTRRNRTRKILGGAWGAMNALRGLQYNLVTLGNNFAGKPTPSSANPYPTQKQYTRQ